jgi:hypothetical protein
MKNWEAWAWLAWYLAFAVLEGIGLWKRHVNEGMTLTFFTEQHAPRWALAALLGWLTYHFLIATPSKG